MIVRSPQLEDVKGRKRRWGGILTAELVLAFPLLTMFLAAMVELTMLASAQQQLTVASREAARVAARGGSQEAVELAARNALGPTPLAACAVQVGHLVE